MSEGLKGQYAQLISGLGVTKPCKNPCTAKHKPLSLLKAFTLKTTGCSSALSPQSTTCWQQALRPAWQTCTQAAACELVSLVTVMRTCWFTKLCGPLKHPDAELYNWEIDHPGYALVFGSGRAKWDCFLHICIFTSQSCIQWHHNRRRQKHRWSYATQQLRENLLVIDSVGLLLLLFFLHRKMQPNLFPSILLPPSTLPTSFSPSPHLLCYHYQQAVRCIPLEKWEHE